MKVAETPSCPFVQWRRHINNGATTGGRQSYAVNIHVDDNYAGNTTISEDVACISICSNAAAAAEFSDHK